MKKLKAGRKKITLDRETLYSLETQSERVVRVAGAKALQCSVQICPQDLASGPPSAGTSCSHVAC